jgi:hypothetical protein
MKRLSVIHPGEREGARQAFAKVETAVQTWIDADLGAARQAEIVCGMAMER